MEDNMTSKEFDLLISMILEMLKDGQTEKVIKLLEETKNGSDYLSEPQATKIGRTCRRPLFN